MPAHMTENVCGVSCSTNTELLTCCGHRVQYIFWLYGSASELPGIVYVILITRMRTTISRWSVSISCGKLAVPSGCFHPCCEAYLAHRSYPVSFQLPYNRYSEPWNTTKVAGNSGCGFVKGVRITEVRISDFWLYGLIKLLVVTATIYICSKQAHMLSAQS